MLHVATLTAFIQLAPRRSLPHSRLARALPRRLLFDPLVSLLLFSCMIC